MEEELLGARKAHIMPSCVNWVVLGGDFESDVFATIPISHDQIMNNSTQMLVDPQSVRLAFSFCLGGGFLEESPSAAFEVCT